MSQKSSESEQSTVREQVKIGATLFLVSHIFAGNNDKKEAWLSIITRAENLKAKS